MEKFSQKYCIIQLLEGRSEGDEWPMSEWPLHVTIVDVFAVDLISGDIFNKLSDTLSKLNQFTVVVGEDDFFGPEKEVQVALLNPNNELLELHRKVISLLEKAGATFNNPQYLNEGYRAHSTVQKHARLHEGDSVIFKELAIVDMFPNNDPKLRKVLKKFAIGT